MMRPTPMKLTIAAALAMGTALVAVHQAEAAAPTTAPAAVKPETNGDHIQRLRSIRHTLNETIVALRGEETEDDKAGHRPAALKALEQARDAVNDEIVEFEKATPKK